MLSPLETPSSCQRRSRQQVSRYAAAKPAAGASNRREQGEQEGMEDSSKLNVKKVRGGGDMRFNTGDVMELRATLSKAAVNKIKKLGFDDCLEISLFDLGCRDLIREVHSKCKVVRFNGQSYILFDMDPENPYYMTPETVGVILGAPKGMDSNAMPSTSNVAKLDELLREVFDLGSKENITTGHILDAAKFARDCGDVDVDIKSFFLLLFNGVLMPHSSPYISSGIMGYAEDLESIGKVDWCKLVLENIALGFECKSIFNAATLLIFFSGHY